MGAQQSSTGERPEDDAHMSRPTFPPKGVKKRGSPTPFSGRLRSRRSRMLWPRGCPAGTLSLLLLFVLGGKNGALRGDRAPQPTPPQLLPTRLVLPRGPGALPDEADGLVQAVGKLLAGVGIAATVGGAVLQNVAETGRPRRS